MPGHWESRCIECWSEDTPSMINNCWRKCQNSITKYPNHCQKVIITYYVECEVIYRKVEARDLIQKLISPEQSRASFEMILVHPWLKKSFFQQQNTRTQQQPQPKKSNWRKKLLRLLTKILILIVKGPYPPPTSYHDLAYTTKKQKQD